MTTLREVAQQALEALEAGLDVSPILAGEAEEALRAALAQQDEPAQQPAFHGFMSDDGTQVDLCFTPNSPRSDGTYATAYYTAPPHRVAQQAEPVQEPVGEILPNWSTEQERIVGTWAYLNDLGTNLPVGAKLYAAPPQRKPLTEEVAALTAQRDALLEALKELVAVGDNVKAGPQTWLARARAAIKAVEEAK